MNLCKHCTSRSCQAHPPNAHSYMQARTHTRGYKHRARTTTLTRRYERLESLLERCYPNTPLRPSPEELRELFKLAGGY